MKDDHFAAQTKLYGQALLRMKRAHDRGTGCRLTSEMIEAMSVMLIAEWWDDVNPETGESAQ